MARPSRLERFERRLLAVFGPAQLGGSRGPQESPPEAVPGERVDGGWVRKGTPGHYYLARADDDD